MTDKETAQDSERDGGKLELVLRRVQAEKQYSMGPSCRPQKT